MRVMTDNIPSSLFGSRGVNRSMLYSSISSHNFDVNLAIFVLPSICEPRAVVSISE